MENFLFTLRCELSEKGNNKATIISSSIIHAIGFLKLHYPSRYFFQPVTHLFSMGKFKNLFIEMSYILGF